MAKGDHVQCKRDGLSGSVEGAPFTLNEGDILPASDPIVKAYPNYFEPVRPKRMRPEVEDTTSEPGRKRGAA